MLKYRFLLFFECFLTSLLFAGIPPSNHPEEILSKNNNSDTKLLSLDFHDIPVAEAVRAICLQQGINIQLDPEIKGNISAHITNLPIKECMHLLLSNIDASFKQDGPIYKIIKKEKTDKNISINITNGYLDLQATDAPLKKILHFISKKSKLNFTFDPNIHGSISAHLKNIELLKGLSSLLLTNGYTLKKNNNIYIVKRNLANSQLSIKYKNNKLFIRSTNTHLKEIFQEISAQTGSSIICTKDIAGKATALIQNESLKNALKLLLIGTPFQCKKHKNVYIIGNGNNLKTPSSILTKSIVYSLKHIRAKDIIKKLPKSIPLDNLQFFDEHNAIAISGSEDLINNTLTFIKKIDKPIAQIKVDVLIIEYDRSVNKKHGLKQSGFRSSLLTPNTETLFNLGKDSNNISFTYDIAEGLTKKFFTHLSFLIDNNRAKVTANPSICTLNGQEASIDVVTEDRFREQIYSDKTDSLSPYGQTKTIESGVKLKIQPWITGDGEINLTIEPEVSNATGVFSADQLPQTTKRKARTVLKIKDGHTLIIGGLLQSHTEQTKQEIPILRKIPLINKLFSHSSTRERRTELVFYITPTISKGSQKTTIKKAPSFFKKTELEFVSDSPSTQKKMASKRKIEVDIPPPKYRYLNRPSKNVTIDNMGQFRREGFFVPHPTLIKRENNFGFEEKHSELTSVEKEKSAWDRAVDKIIEQDNLL